MSAEPGAPEITFDELEGMLENLWHLEATAPNSTEYQQLFRRLSDVSLQAVVNGDSKFLLIVADIIKRHRTRQ
jgi:hypothetical protein